MPAPIARLRRVTDLFVTGVEHYLGEDDDGPVLVWIRKPNSFERQECQRDGLFGQAKVVASLHDESDEIVQVREDAERRGVAALIEDALEQKGMEFAYKGRQDVEADEEWAERLPLVQRAGLLDEGSAVTAEERRQITLAQAQFVDAIRAAAEKRRQDMRRDLQREPVEDILKQYVDGFRQLRGMTAYNEEYTLTELYYALRECNAVRQEASDRWDHTACTHKRLFTEREQVREQPDEMLAPLINALRDLTATPAEAGKLGRSVDFLRVVGAAKLGGGLNSLYPDGDVSQAGWDLTEAISSALQVLGFMERPEEEVPPPEIWHHEERLHDWFAAVKQDREDRMNGVERVPDPELEQNEYVKDLLGRR